MTMNEDVKKALDFSETEERAETKPEKSKKFDISKFANNANCDIINPNETRNKAKILIVGESGTGKTYAFRTMPNIHKSIILDIGDENGVSSLHDVKGLNALNIADLEQLKQALIGLRKEPGIETVYIETVTSIDRLYKEEVLKKAGKHEDDIGLREYGMLKSRLVKFIDFISSYPKNVVLTCHTREEKDDDLGIIMKKPSITGSLKNEIERRFDIVLYSMVGKKDKQAHYKWVTERTSRYPAKDRFGCLPTPSMEQDFTELYNKIKCGKEE